MLYDPFGNQLYLSEYDGIVVYTDDPEKAGRVRCKVPEVLGDVLSDWASPSYQGMEWVPDIGSLVTVSFKAGDPSQPRWKGKKITSSKGVRGDSKYAGSNLFTGYDTQNDPSVSNRSNVFGFSEPSSSYAAKYPNNRVIRTKNGIVVEIDDTPGAQRVHIYHPSGSYYELRPDGSLAEKIKGDHTVVIEGAETIQFVGVSEIKGLTALQINAPLLFLNGRPVTSSSLPI